MLISCQPICGAASAITAMELFPLSGATLVALSEAGPACHRGVDTGYADGLRKTKLMASSITERFTSQMTET